MLKDIFYIVEEEMCNKCWNQLAQAIKKVKNNNPQEINNLMFFKYYLKDQITALASKVIIIIKCNNNFYTLFWKQDLLKSEINSDNLESEYLPQGLILNEQIVNDVILSLKDKNNQHYNLNDNKNLNVLSNNNSVLFDDNMLGSFLPIPVFNAEVIQITNVKRKSKHWLWILVIISVLLLTSGIGVIGYQMYRQSSHSNLVNSKIIVSDDNPVGEVKDENKDFILEDNNFDEQINEQSKDIILEENNLLDEVKDENKVDNYKDNENKDAILNHNNFDDQIIEEEIIDISQYSYDFTKNPLNLIEVQALDIVLIKPELLKLSEVSHPLQTLLENNKLKITLLQEPEMINDNVEYIILLQLDAINIKGYTGQAVLHLGVKVKPVVASGVININGVVDLNGGIVGKYARTDFTKHFNSLLKLYDNSMVFTIDAWQAYLPALGTRIEISQAQKNNLASVLNKQYRPKLEVTNIYQNGDVKHLKISWKFVDLKNNEKIINIMPYVHEQAFDQFHLQGNFKYNLKISYTSKTN